MDSYSPASVASDSSSRGRFVGRGLGDEGRIYRWPRTGRGRTSRWATAGIVFFFWAPDIFPDGRPSFPRSLTLTSVCPVDEITSGILPYSGLVFETLRYSNHTIKVSITEEIAEGTYHWPKEPARGHHCQVAPTTAPKVVSSVYQLGIWGQAVWELG